MIEYEFEVRGGMVTVDGKPTWPNFITLTMDRIGAIDIAIQLLKQLEDQKSQTVVIQSVGRLENNSCTCKPTCPSPCKGECGCKACHEAYMDFLASE
jgi:hypothetical protein